MTKREKSKDGKEDSKGDKLPNKEKNFSGWYQELIVKSGLADYSSISGCIVFKPLSYEIWNLIKKEVDSRFKALGIKNVYFPLFIPERLLEKEAEHVQGFKPEVAWVTHAGGHKLDERLAIRPTSEAIMYESYSKWIRSWRDLPLKLNQWNNAVRWEFKHPVPFLRSREFLWNEGHNAYSTEKESMDDVWKILNIYKDVCENYLAIYGILGQKTEKEKFAGAVSSYAIEFLLPNGRVVQGPDAHFDGQNFAKAYDITFLDKNQKRHYVWQITYAISTRIIGVMAAIHSDNKGLVLPPRIAPNKITIIPIYDDKTKKQVMDEAVKLKKRLSSFNAVIDDSDHSPGYKFNEWELSGTPLRIDLGMHEIKSKKLTIVRRDNHKRMKISGKLKEEIQKLLDDMQESLFEKSKQFVLKNIVKANNMDELKKAINEKKVVKANFCGNSECEDGIKAEVEGVTTRVIDMNEKPKKAKCIYCGKPAKHVAYFAKTY